MPGGGADALTAPAHKGKSRDGRLEVTTAVLNHRFDSLGGAKKCSNFAGERGRHNCVLKGIQKYLPQVSTLLEWRRKHKVR